MKKVTMKTVISALVFIIGLLLTSCEEFASFMDNPVEAYLQVDTTTIYLIPGQDTIRVASTISTESVHYQSSNENIATVDQNGKVTAKAVGTTIITINVKGNEYYNSGTIQYRVIVMHPVTLKDALKENAIVSFSFKINDENINVDFKKEGNNYQLQESALAAIPRRAETATNFNYSLLYDDVNNLLSFAVKQTAGSEIINVLTVIFDVNNKTTQIIPGSSMVKVLDFIIIINNYDVTSQLTKKEVPPTSIDIPETLLLNLGESKTLFVTILPEDATNKNVTWTSSNEKVATVDDMGNVTAGATGEAIISANVDKLTVTCSVTVNITGLPVVYVNTPDEAPITSKETWMKNTTITIYDTDGTIDYEDSKLQIRGRGNSTWGYPKKPYALKLDSKASILGMPKHKRWCLLANWMDRTLMRNDVAFQIAKQTGLDWTPRGKFVEVIFNGKHIGNYYLCEQIKIDKNRVNIVEMKETDIDGDEITGGYLMELDVYFDEINKFKSAIRNLPYMFKEPDEDVLQPVQLAYFEGYINDMESAMYAEDWLDKRSYTKYMNLESFVDWWFVHELAGNGEPGHPKSSYMHKDRLGKLTAGPVWDFDWGTFTPGDYFVIKNAIYYGRLFNDPEFVSLVKKRWTILKPKFELIPDYIRSTATQIKVSNNINNQLWPISTSVNGDEKMSFEEAIERMISAYTSKLQWLNTQITSW